MEQKGTGDFLMLCRGDPAAMAPNEPSGGKNHNAKQISRGIFQVSVSMREEQTKNN